MIVLQEHDGEFPSYHFAFTVNESDLERAAAVLRECGVPTRGPISHSWIPGTSVYFEDLDGHERNARRERIGLSAREHPSAR